MKLDKLFTIFWGFVLAFALSFGCTACIATAFSAELSVDLAELALWCAFYALIASLCFSFKLELIFINVSLVLLYVFCKYSEMISSFQSLLQELSSLFNEGYGWGTFSWDIEYSDHTQALQAVGSVICASSAWTVCRKRLSVWAIAGSILPFLPCTFMLRTVPEERYLIMWLAAMLLLVLTQSTRRRKEKDGNKLAAMLLFPTVLAVIALFALSPMERYDGRDRAEELLEKLETYFDSSHASFTGQVIQEQRVDLTEVGSQNLPYRPVMQIVSPRSEGCYLRGRAYDIYDGKSWSDSGIDSQLPWREYYGEREEFRITTKHIEPYLFQPYRLYGREHQYAGNGLENEDETKEYSYNVYSDEFFTVPVATIAERVSDWQRLTELPEKTLIWANDLWNELLMAISMVPDASMLAHCIEALLSEKAYSLDTGRMSEDYDDFARWFTDESPTGYCVHFATAATVLLRAKGVPARYVTGYYVQSEAQKQTTVYEKNAHAWVEYWSESSGWTVFDPTPSEEVFSQPEQTQPTETTERPTLPQKPTKPTEPSQMPTEPKPTTQNAPAEPSAKKDESIVLPESVKQIALALLVLGLIFAQSRVRVSLRRKYTGDNNERALKIWRHLKKCSVPDTDLPIELARKAKFSNHAITDDELAQMQNCLEDAIEALRKRSWYRKVIDRIVFAIY